uniref:insulinase family protein n=1 Tax=Galbibacter sp. PAP.153 TaxID=3104623 RepID=UPI0030093A30
KAYGFTNTEFNKTKTDLFESLKKSDTTAVSYWREEFRNHFVYGKGLPQNKIGLLKKILNNLTLEEVNNFFKDRINKTPEDIGLIAPTANMALSYTEKTIRNWFFEADTSKTIPYADPIIPSTLMDPIKVSGLKCCDYKEGTTDIPGIKKYLLSNGVKLIFNSFKPAPDILGGSESVIFKGFVSNGASCFSKKDYFSAINAPGIIKNSGVGGKDKFDIERYLSNQGFKQYVTPYIGYKESGIRGSTTTTLKDLETALQLTYLYITAPNYNELAYEDWKMSAPKRYLNDLVQDDLITTVKNVFNDSLFLPKGSKRMEGVGHTDMRLAYSIYNKLFGNVQDFTFLFSGNFQEEELLLLCRKYLGNIPNTTEHVECEQGLKTQEDIPEDPFIKTFPARKNIHNVRVRMVYVTPLDKTSLDWKEKTKLMLLSRFLEYSFLKHLRKNSEKGGPYVAFVSNDNNDGVSGYNKFSIDFGCSPEDVDRLVMESKQIIENLKKSPSTEIKLFKAVKKRLMPVSDIETNKEMLEKMYLHYKYGYPWVGISDVRDYMGSLSLKDLQESAQKWLISEPFEFKMVPPE